MALQMEIGTLVRLVLVVHDSGTAWYPKRSASSITSLLKDILSSRHGTDFLSPFIDGFASRRAGARKNVGSPPNIAFRGPKQANGDRSGCFISAIACGSER